MATVILTAVGTALGGPIGGAVGGAFGTYIDQTFLFNKRGDIPDTYGPRSDTRVQVSTYGKNIPRVYGDIRLPGNVVWAQTIKEVEVRETTSTETGGKGGGGKISTTNVRYEYYATLAIAICEGEIDDITRIRADSKVIDNAFIQQSVGKYEEFLGAENQAVSSIIESYESAGNIPAYRGTAYVVFEDLPLAPFGNRIPNITFDVRRSVQFSPTVEEKVKDIVVIPGSGEFVYATDVVTKQDVELDYMGNPVITGREVFMNMQNFENVANVQLAVDHLLDTFPNLEWVALVVNWFVTTKVVADALVIPKTEFNSATAQTTPVSWSVGAYDRGSAEVVEAFGDGTPTYGGTPSDLSVMQLVKEFKDRGLNVLFYPMPLVDTTTEMSGEDDKPWRGRLIPTSSADVSTFFTRTEGYNAFIRHYSQLSVGGDDLKDFIDAFIIGSELVGLTTFDSGSNVYPAVAALKTLAANVQTDLGGTPLVGYAADWSEYHSIGGYYHMDTLWTDANIDFVGIDNYMPITPDLPQSQITEAAIQQYWEDGEGWAYFYNQDRSAQYDYTPNDGTSPSAWKNVERWWNQAHTHWGANTLSGDGQIDSGYSSSQGSISANVTTDVRGASVADKFTENTANAAHYVQASVAGDNTLEWRFYAEVKAAGRTKGIIQILDLGGTGNTVIGTYDLTAGTIVASDAGNGTVNYADITDLGDGWFALVIFGTPNTSDLGNVGARIRLANASGTLSYLGDGSSGIYVGRTMLSLANQATGWTSKLKPVWFTEWGFPSVDGAANQPNVFYDPSSDESFFPRLSRGRVDFKAQREAINATLDFWQAKNLETGNANLVPRMFLWTWDARPFPYWPDLASVWDDAGNWQTGHWVQGKLGGSTLGAIVQEICMETGLTASQIDASLLTEYVEGFLLDHRMQAREALETLATAYLFDMVESGGVLKFVPQGGDLADTLAEDDLVPLGTEPVRYTMEITRKQDLELPRVVDVTYLNRESGFLAASQQAQRQTVQTQERVTYNLPLVLTDRDARNLAEKILYLEWVKRTRYELQVGPQYMLIEPTDSIQVNANNGVSHRMRVVKTQLGPNGVMNMLTVAEDVSAYDFYFEPGGVPTNPEQGSNLADTLLYLLDLPAFPQDIDTLGRLRVGVVGSNDTWRGAVVYRSPDGGEAGGNTFNALVTFDSEVIAGTALTEITGGPTNEWDDALTIDIALRNGTLSSVTELAVLNGANACAIGDEIIQFQTATLIDTNKYRLSRLLRGRLGTEWAIDGHSASESFVLIDSALDSEPMSVSLIGVQRHYKAVTVGQAIADVDETAFTYTGKSLKPYSPVQIAGERDGSSNLTITWIRRDRLNGEMRDNVDVANSEASESYEIDIYDGGTIVRTITGLTSPEYEYTAANQTTDFGSPQSAVDIKIYQISAIVGRGYAGEATV